MIGALIWIGLGIAHGSIVLDIGGCVLILVAIGDTPSKPKGDHH